MKAEATYGGQTAIRFDEHSRDRRRRVKAEHF